MLHAQRKQSIRDRVACVVVKQRVNSARVSEVFVEHVFEVVDAVHA